MKVKELLETIEKRKEENPDILDWDIYIQVVHGYNLEDKKSSNWKFIKDSEDWEYIQCAGYNTFFIKDKILTINADY